MAADAVEIDSTSLSADEVVSLIAGLARERRRARARLVPRAGPADGCGAGEMTMLGAGSSRGVPRRGGSGAEDYVPVPVVAVVGRPNVGKSTLVNRILGSRQAVVQDTPGVTRDRVAYDAFWRGRAFTLVDTGGWEPSPGSEAGQASRALAEQVTAQARLAVEAADAVLFVVDAVVGITDSDEAVAAVLRRSGKPVVVAANKVDDAPGRAGRVGAVVARAR